MKLFNAFQITTLFAGMPFLLTWLYTDPFPHAKSTALWVAGIAYFITYILHIVSVRHAMDKDGPLDF